MGAAAWMLIRLSCSSMSNERGKELHRTPSPPRLSHHPSVRAEEVQERLQKQMAAALRQRPVAVGEHLVCNRVPAAAQRLPLPRRRFLLTLLQPRNQVRCSLG